MIRIWLQGYKFCDEDLVKICCIKKIVWIQKSMNINCNIIRLPHVICKIVVLDPKQYSASAMCLDNLKKGLTDFDDKSLLSDGQCQ